MNDEQLDKILKKALTPQREIKEEEIVLKKRRKEEKMMRKKRMKIKEIGLVNSLRMNYHYFGWGG